MEFGPMQESEFPLEKQHVLQLCPRHGFVSITYGTLHGQTAKEPPKRMRDAVMSHRLNTNASSDPLTVAWLRTGKI